VPRQRGEPRIYTAFRCKPVARKMLDDKATENELDLSGVIRAALAVAFAHEAELDLTIKQIKEQG
jgi:hypothetical protein